MVTFSYSKLFQTTATLGFLTLSCFPHMAHAMEKEEIEDLNSSTVQLKLEEKEIPSRQLTHEEIEEFNKTTVGYKITNTFNPSEITTLVVGCNEEDHEGHFFGKIYENAEYQEEGVT